MGRVLSAGILVSAILLAGCEARLVLGAACIRGGECPAPLICAERRCRTECIEQRDCPLGARCVVDPGASHGRCSLGDDPDCRMAAHECAASLLCVAGSCVNACETATSCPPGSTCVPDVEGRGYCERSDVDAAVDAAPADAGPDAVPSDVPAIDGPESCTGGPSCDEPVAVAVAPSASCAMTERGRIWCWGYAPMVGSGATYPACAGGDPCTATPVRVRAEISGPVSELDGAARVVGGRVFSAIVGGRLLSWGSPTRTLGASGGGEIARLVRLAPPASGFVPAIAEEAALGFTAAFVHLTGGSELMWGDDEYAQRGAGGGPGSDFAEPGSPHPGGRLPSLGGWHGCGIRPGPSPERALRVECWGENDVGQAGGTAVGAGAIVAVATVVPGVPVGATMVVSGRSQSCALVAGVVWCWGAASAIGRAFPSGCTAGACPPAPVTWAGGSFTAIYGGPYAERTCATDDAGALYCWGPGAGAEPTSVAVPPPVSAAALGDLHACAIAAGEVWCWGANAFGQLGRGPSEDAVLPPGAVVWP